MPACSVCGKDVGFRETLKALGPKHLECKAAEQAEERRVAEVRASAIRVLKPAARGNMDLSQADEVLEALEMLPERARSAQAEAWRGVLKEFLSDDLITDPEEAALRRFQEHYGLAQSELDHRNSWRDFERAIAERERRKAERIRRNAEHLIVDAAHGNITLPEMDEELDALGFAKSDARRFSPVAWGRAVDEALEDGLLSQEEENALSEFRQHFDLSQSQLDDNGRYTRLVQAGVLRDVMEGTLPERMNITSGRLPFNLMKSEDIVWVFQNAGYYKTKTEREFRGSSMGVSVRVASGVYLRPSQFRGRSHSREVTIHADTGLLGITTKHFYFHGERERFRVRHDKIVSFEAYDDGIGIMRDNLRAKPEAFVVGDGWFIYNLVTNINNIAP